MKRFLLFAVLVLFGSRLMAQTNVWGWIKSNQQKAVKTMNVQVNMPSGYIDITDEGPACDCDGKTVGSSPDFVFMRKDSSVIINIALLPKNTADYAKGKPTDWSVDNPNNVWQNNFKANADTVRFTYTYYGKAQLKKYNADNGVEFYMTCDNLYMNKYQVARAINLNRKYKGIIEIRYLTRNGEITGISKEIKESAGMIHFDK